MKTVTEFLEKLYVEESFEIEGGGIGRLPFQKEDVDEGEKQQLPWSKSKE